MAKTVDVPLELRAFNDVFEKLGGYRWDEAKVFHDLCDYIIACFLTTGDKDCAEKLKKEYGTEYPIFHEMFRELLLAQEKVLKRKLWYDGLGTYYEIIKSKSKSSALGQFFTPETIVDFMTEIQLDEKNLPKGKKVNDPASGSGRFLIAFHANAPGNYQYGCDIDSICAKMTAINMCISGCVGQAICGDALMLGDSYRFGFEVNRYLTYHHFPSLERISKEESFEFGFYKNAILEKQVKVEPERINGDFVPATNEIIIDKKGQFSMF